MRPLRPIPVAQAVAAAVLLPRMARGRGRRAPLTDGAPEPVAAVTVVVPARDEAARIGPCLRGLRGRDVVVVDDRSTDDTAAVAAALGARVVTGAPLPAGWCGKAWALQQGLTAASGEWVVFLDADTRPRPGLIPALVAAAEDHDVLSATARFVCHGVGERLVHPAMTVTMPLRFGAGDVPHRQPSPRRAVMNGQCIVVRRERLLEAGGWERVRGHLTEDVALARSLRGEGWRIGQVDASDMLEIRMYTSVRETWTGWARSLMAPDATPPLQQLGDVAMLWLAMGLPLPRLLAGRGTPLDAGLLALRLALHGALARSYRPRGAAFWCSPLLDPAVVGWLTWRAIRPDRRWRGRTYDQRPRAGVTRRGGTGTTAGAPSGTARR